jgi:hypothetical protein
MCSNCGWDAAPDESDCDETLEEEKLDCRASGFIARNDPDEMERLIARDSQRALEAVPYAIWQSEVAKGSTKLSFDDWRARNRGSEGCEPKKIGRLNKEGAA